MTNLTQTYKELYSSLPDGPVSLSDVADWMVVQGLMEMHPTISDVWKVTEEGFSLVAAILPYILLSGTGSELLAMSIEHANMIAAQTAEDGYPEGAPGNGNNREHHE